MSVATIVKRIAMIMARDGGLQLATECGNSGDDSGGGNGQLWWSIASSIQQQIVAIVVNSGE